MQRSAVIALLTWIALLAVVLPLSLAVPSAALRVEGMKIMANLTPGGTYVQPMAVAIDPTDAPVDVAIDLMGIGNYPAGYYRGLSPADDTGPYTARPYITVTATKVHLNPGDRYPFNAIIKVPEQPGDGGRYAAILIHPVSAQGPGAGAGITTAMLVPVLVTLTGSNMSQAGSITGITADVTPGKPVLIETTLANTGNYHYYGALVNLTVTDPAGNVIATASSAPSFFALFPGNSMTIPVSVTAAFTPGTYTVTSVARIAQGLTLLDSRTSTLTITAAYTPPFQAASIDLTPDRDAALATPDGVVTVRFPAGSVIAPVHVTVKPPDVSLAAAPSTATAGSTSLSIEGITGLLARDATLTVKYSPADLKAAGGDSSKLVIARWDADVSQWTLLPTTVDSSAGTLTIQTNRLGIMEVMGSSQVPGPAASPTKTPGPDSLLIVAGSSASLLFFGRRKTARIR